MTRSRSYPVRLVNFSFHIVHDSPSPPLESLGEARITRDEGSSSEFFFATEIKDIIYMLSHLEAGK